MALLPVRSYSEQAAVNTLLSVKKGNQQAQGEFIWQNQERFYAIAYLSCKDAQTATQLTITAFQDVLTTLKSLHHQQINNVTWDWLADFIVNVCAEYHDEHSRSRSGAPYTDPTSDGSALLDWETTVILSPIRVKRCLAALSESERQVYVLRHQLGLNYSQIAAVLNQSVDNVMAWLFRARVAIVKCLGRG